MRKYIQSVVKFCEKKGNESLVRYPDCNCNVYRSKILQWNLSCWPTIGFSFKVVIWKLSLAVAPRRDKYDSNVFKYHVEVDEDDEDVDEHVERERKVSTKVGSLSPCIPTSIRNPMSHSYIAQKLFFDFRYVPSHRAFWCHRLRSLRWSSKTWIAKKTRPIWFQQLMLSLVKKNHGMLLVSMSGCRSDN